MSTKVLKGYDKATVDSVCFVPPADGLILRPPYFPSIEYTYIRTKPRPTDHYIEAKFVQKYLFSRFPRPRPSAATPFGADRRTTSLQLEVSVWVEFPTE